MYTSICSIELYLYICFRTFTRTWKLWPNNRNWNLFGHSNTIFILYCNINKTYVMYTARRVLFLHTVLSSALPIEIGLRTPLLESAGELLLFRIVGYTTSETLKNRKHFQLIYFSGRTVIELFKIFTV